MVISDFTVSENIVEVACSGKVSADGLRGLIIKVKAILESKPQVKNILVDLTGIEGKLNFMEHFAIGDDVAAKLKGYKLAVVINKNVVNKVAENVATKQGAKMLMTYEKKNAFSWFKDSR
jgi:hypothetical protein